VQSIRAPATVGVGNESSSFVRDGKTTGGSRKVAAGRLTAETKSRASEASRFHFGMPSAAQLRSAEQSV